MKKILLSAALVAASLSSIADPVQQSTITTGDNSKVENSEQLIGDTDASNNDITSTSTQLGNSANNNGASISTDTRDQNTFNPNTTITGGSTDSNATGGSSIGNQSANDNKLSISGVSTGPSSSTSDAQGGAGGMASSSSGGNTLSNGSSSGGNQLSQSARSSSDGSGNSVTSVDASNNSKYNSRATVWAPIIPGPAPAPLAAGRLIQSTGECGPRARTYDIPVYGTRFQLLGGQQQVVQGYAHELAIASIPYIYHETELPHGKIATVFGSRVEAYTATLGTSSAGSLVVGGFGKQGDGGQVGTNTGGSLEQIVQRYTIRECVISQVFIPSVQPTQIVLHQTLIPEIAPAQRQDRN